MHASTFDEPSAATSDRSPIAARHPPTCRSPAPTQQQPPTTISPAITPPQVASTQLTATAPTHLSSHRLPPTRVRLTHLDVTGSSEPCANTSSRDGPSRVRSRLPSLPTFQHTRASMHSSQAKPTGAYSTGQALPILYLHRHVLSPNHYTTRCTAGGVVLDSSCARGVRRRVRQ